MIGVVDIVVTALADIVIVVVARNMSPCQKPRKGKSGLIANLAWTSGLRFCWRLGCGLVLGICLLVRPGARNLLERPGAWNLLAEDLWVDVLLEARDAAWCWEDKGAYSLQSG